MQNKGFLVTSIKDKGGTGGTTMAYHQIANFDFFGMDFDSTGNLYLRRPEEVSRMFDQEGNRIDVDRVVVPEGYNYIADFGSERHPDALKVAEASNLVVCTTTIDDGSIMTLKTMLKWLKHIKTPMLFIINSVSSNSDFVQGQIEKLLANIQHEIGRKEVDYILMSHSEYYMMTGRDDKPIMEMLGVEYDKRGRKVPDFMRKQKASKEKRELKELYQTIMSYK